MKPLILFILVLVYISGNAQQIADTSYHPMITHPAYAKGKGPVIFIDEGHHNFHTKTGRYLPFANLLERDGYKVDAFADEFTMKNLSKGKILVISNALNEINEENWYLPTPSAFSNAEIASVKDWVYKGGSLFLIADHMPMAGAAQDLAAVFGFEIANGFVLHTVTNGLGYFNLTDGSLIESPVTLGRDSSERVKQIVTFTGQGFKIPRDATSILTFDENYTCLMPDTAWVFPESTPRINIKGWSQGAYLKYGKGRVVLFGEAAMFTAQLSGELQTKVGMNSDKSPENFKLLLNIVHWLDGKLE
ncbi:MAG: DUF4350 domain-containing protein [Saprospiraceae bacterium]